jgi:4'-phosphopantetheinyl transferase
LIDFVGGSRILRKSTDIKDNQDLVECLKNKKMIEIFAVKINNPLAKSRFDKLLSCVSDEKKERIRRFYRYEDAQRTLIGDILVRYLLCRRLGIKNEMLVFRANRYGKPFLTNSSEIQYNISHSGKWVVCSIHNLPIGIDVEHIKPIDVSIAEKFFTKQEFNELTCKNEAEKMHYFYDLFTLKESYIKAEGKGLSIPLDSFIIKIDENSISVSPINESVKYYFRQYCIDEEYRLSICARKNEFPRNIVIYDIQEIYEEICCYLGLN